MPIYEYQCSHCGYSFETLQKSSEPHLTICTKCNENSLVKLISAAGFQLKGNGWYQTDFKNPAPQIKEQPAVKDTPPVLT